MRHWVHWLAVSVLLWALMGCGSSESSGKDTGCVPGETQECACAGYFQECKQDGSGYEPCNCPTSDTSGDTADDTADDTSIDTADDTSIDTADDTSIDTSDDTGGVVVTCGDNATLTDGQCACNAGYEGNADVACADIDECDGVNCGPGGTCSHAVGETTAGDYTCTCEAGFEGGGVNKPCKGCNNDGTCDDDENFVNCPADCNALCTNSDDAALLSAPSGDGSWAEGDCLGIKKHDFCIVAGVVGDGFLCDGASGKSPCEAMDGCVWLGDQVGCVGTAFGKCAVAGEVSKAACLTAGCKWGGIGPLPCLPKPSESKCNAGSALPASINLGAVCQWNAATNTCEFPKTGADVVGSVVTQCGLECISNADPFACTVACAVGDEVIGQMTLGCFGCYLGVLECTLSNCVAQCASIASVCNGECSAECMAASVACGACGVNKGCAEKFDACTSGASN